MKTLNLEGVLFTCNGRAVFIEDVTVTEDEQLARFMGQNERAFITRNASFTGRQLEIIGACEEIVVVDKIRVVISAESMLG